jgi:phasin family protein
MAQAKKSNAAKLASTVASKAAKNTYDVIGSGRASAENVVKLAAGEAQKMQDKVIALSRDGADKIAKSADAVSKAFYESISSSRENIEAVVECSNVAAALAKDVSTEMFEYANKSFSDSVEVSKELFACRTINDMMELQNRVMKSAMDNAFAQTTRLSELFFEYSSEALEPINERVASVSEQFSKTLNAA